MKRVLIVDEDTDVLRLLRVKLNAAGYEVLQARDGAEAQAHAAEHRPDLIVMEQLLPDMNGLELLNGLREALNPLPVILILSGETDDEAIAYMFSAGASDYVTKPFSPQALIERIRVNMIRAQLNAPVEEAA